MQIMGRKNQRITSVETWLSAAGPKGKEAQWVDYRSAKELARAWFPKPGDLTVPPELAALLGSHPFTTAASFDEAVGYPELRVRFDDLAGEPRNTDLAIVCNVANAAGAQRVAISVEAKADESFGGRVSSAIEASEARRASGKASFGDRRARELLAAVLGSKAVSDPESRGLRYQLLTATAGALAFAKDQNADVAVLAVHEFVHGGGRYTAVRKLEANAKAFDAFVLRLSNGGCSHLPEGVLIGPYHVPGSPDIPASLPLLIGKMRRVLE